MALKPKLLQPARTGELKEAVDQQMEAINVSLREHIAAWGRNVVAYPLPTTFGVGVDRSTAQRFVYSSIIKNLRDRGFEVRILIEKSTTMLYVAWEHAMSDKEIQAMERTIRQHQITRDRVDAFKRGAAGRSSRQARQQKSD
jgi:hypothetical protein